MSRAINLAIGLTIVTGLYVWVSESWNAIYRANLILHPLIGLATTVLLVVYAASHIKDKLKGEGGVSAGRIALFVALPAVGVVLGHALGQARWLPLVVVAALLIGPLRRIGRFVAKRLRHAPAVLLGGAALALWIAAVATGLPMLALEGGAVTHSEIYSHRGFSLAAAALFVGHLLFIRVYRAERFETPETLRARADLSVALKGVAACAVALVAVLGAEQLAPRTSFEVQLFRIPRGDHPQPLDPPLAGVEQRALEVESSCATSGCHETVVDDYQHSTHRLSPRTPYFQRTVALMEEEQGEEKTLVCAGCHYPQALLTAERNVRDYAGDDRVGFTCMSCHSIADVSFDASEKRKSSMLLEPPMAHLGMFVDGSGEKIDGLALHMIRMNPLGHGRAMSPGPQHEQSLCLACHHNEIEPAESGAFEFPECESCHMQVPEMLERPGTEKNHVFPGANTAVPFALGLDDSLAITQGFLANDFELYIDKWGSAWTLRPKGYGHERHRAIYLRMSSKMNGAPRPGEELELEIDTTNVIEHHFPAAPFDLIEVWLHVRVSDAEGRLLLESGAFDERQRVDPDAQRLGGRVIGLDGLPMRQHRIWEENEEIPEERIAPGETHVNRYAVPVPADGVALPLSIEAHWKYRKINPDFTEWAYGREGVVMPTTIVESHVSEWRPPATERAAIASGSPAS